MAKGLIFANGEETQLEVGDKLLFRRLDYTVQVITELKNGRGDNRKRSGGLSTSMRGDDRMHGDAGGVMYRMDVDLSKWAEMFLDILAMAGIEAQQIRDDGDYVAYKITAIRRPEAKLSYLQITPVELFVSFWGI